MANEIKTFQIGKTYFMRSICDYDCIWKYTVINRTKCTVTLRQIRHDGTPSNNTILCRISKGATEIYGAEAVSPLGTYSMSPTLHADNPVSKL